VKVVLYRPQIPANTGNIGRLCLAAGCELALVGPLGFSLSEKAVRRAGVDHWRDVKATVHPDFDSAVAGVADDRLFLFDVGGSTDHWNVCYPTDAVLVFGPENPGLPDEIMQARPHRTFRIPMFGPVRSLNLANAVAVVVYEALRGQRRP